ncbi:DUF192 domain-containing protein [Glaciecola sp. MF2-115]|uniref:DUF192 domain-containing protein n=1 Tax=Glaciecola sp. MF2-115 TaxID=3384827 RepID=UPI00399F9B14
MKNLSNMLTGSIALLIALSFSIQACAQPDKQLSTKAFNQPELEQQLLAKEDELTDEELALLADDSNINIAFARKSLKVEFADTFEERALGLMHRKSLCEDCGMLFQFDSERIASIWMKNTFVPLDLAYITVDGKIVDIKPLQPHDLTSVKSSKPVLFALEMNQGWFAKNGIKVGDKVSIEGRVKQPSF